MQVELHTSKCGEIEWSPVSPWCLRPESPAGVDFRSVGIHLSMRSNPEVTSLWSRQWEGPGSRSAIHTVYHQCYLRVRYLANHRFAPYMHTIYRRTIRVVLADTSGVSHRSK